MRQEGEARTKNRWVLKEGLRVPERSDESVTTAPRDFFIFLPSPPLFFLDIARINWLINRFRCANFRAKSGDSRRRANMNQANSRRAYDTRDARTRLNIIVVIVIGENTLYFARGE